MPSQSEPSTQLTEPEVARLVRLLADALTPDDGREAKVRRLMDGLAAWLDADGWFWVRSRIRPDPAAGPPVNLDFLFGGEVDHAAVAAYADRTLEIDGVPPEHPPMYRLLGEGRPFTVTRRDIVSDDV